MVDGREFHPEGKIRVKLLCHGRGRHNTYVTWRNETDGTYGTWFNANGANPTHWETDWEDVTWNGVKKIRVGAYNSASAYYAIAKAFLVVTSQ
jgi:hypothetical protein